jgi:hypothetical protein
MKKMITIAAAAAVATGGLAVTQPATAAKKYTACVKKSSGEMRLLLGKKKKCAKGWKKTTWTKSGPRGAKGSVGATGAANSMGLVVDGSGAPVGEAMNVASIGPYPLFAVRIDGGVFTYLGNGWLYPQNPPVEYDNAACTGTPFIESNDPILTSYLVSDPGFRAISRIITPALGPATAWKPTGQKTAVVAAPNWYRNESGVCTAGAAFTGDRVGLVQVPAPPDVPGPLRLG